MLDNISIELLYISVYLKLLIVQFDLPNPKVLYEFSF